MRLSMTGIVAGSVLCVAGAAQASSSVFHFDGAQPYSSIADSPIAPLFGPSDHFWVEDFEDGLLNTPGVSALNGSVRLPGPSTDSVDADGAGLLDGSGSDGHSFFSSALEEGPWLTFTFDSKTLGQLPTAAGLVWTDGNHLSSFTFEAFDAAGDSLGVISPALGDGVHSGSTAADRFLGVVFDGGISAISIFGEFGGLEIDHLQYGFAASVIPLPPAVGLGLAGLALVAVRRRRQARVA